MNPAKYLGSRTFSVVLESKIYGLRDFKQKQTSTRERLRAEADFFKYVKIVYFWLVSRLGLLDGLWVDLS
jgi:hypothetical protein